jgi:hypothetical protein
MFSAITRMRDCCARRAEEAIATAMFEGWMGSAMIV